MPNQKPLFAPRQAGDVDRPLRQAPGERAGAGAEHPYGRDGHIHQEVGGMRQGAAHIHALTGQPLRALVPP